MHNQLIYLKLELRRSGYGTIEFMTQLSTFYKFMLTVANCSNKKTQLPIAAISNRLLKFTGRGGSSRGVVVQHDAVAGSENWQLRATSTNLHVSGYG